MKKFFLKTFDWIVFCLALLIVFMAIALSLARLFLPHLTRYQPQVQQWASQAIHQPVQIGRMDAAWRGLEPELKFSQVAILSADGSKILLKVNELGVGIDLVKSLFKWKIVPGWVVISGANVTLNQDVSGKITLNGITTPTTTAESAIEIKEVGQWLLSEDRIYLEHVNATWHGKDGRIIPFHHIQLKLENTFLSHALLGEAAVIQPGVNSRIRFVLNMDGNIFSDKNTQAKLYIKAEKMPLGFWLENRLPNWQITQGIANVEIWADWKQQALQQLQTRFDAKNFNIKSKYLLRDIFVDDFGGHVLWQRQDAGWNLSGEINHLLMNNTALPKTQLSYKVVTAHDSQPATQTFQADHLDIQYVKNLLAETALLSARQSNLLKQLNPSGTLKNFTLIRTNAQPLPGQTAQSANQFSVMTEFEQVSWSRWQKLPGVVNLSGVLDFTPQDGTLTLDSQQTQWNFGNLFRTVLPIDDLRANAKWQKNSDGWQIDVSDMSAANPLISINGNASLFLPTNHSSPIINILAGFNLVNAPQVIRYLPVGIMPKDVVSWLDHAIVAGKDGSGNLVLSGPVNAFPFDHQEGRFIINSQINDLTLNYRAGWPIITHLNAELDFDDSSMNINASSGNVFSAKLKNAQASIADLHQPVLQVNGDAQGDLSDGLQFLLQSPLKTTIGKKLQGFVMQGPMDLNLQLTIPLKTGATKVSGNVSMKDADLKLPQWWNLHVEKLAGNLQFTDTSLAGNLQGNLFNQPLNVNVSTLTPSAQQTITQFDLGAGQMTLEQVQQRFDLPKFPYLAGTLNYHAILQFGSGANAINRLIIDSDLQGISVNLPAPLNKAVSDNVPTELQLIFGQTQQQLQLIVNYGKRLSAALTFLQDRAGKLNLSGGELTFGGKQASLQTKPGLVIDGYLPSFSWSDWQPLLSTGMPKNKKKPSSLLRSVDVTFGQFNAAGISLTQTELQLQPMSQYWQVGIHSANIDGQLNVPYNFPSGVTTSNFQKLYLSSTAQTGKTLLPKDVPAFNLNCQDFHYGDKIIGAIQLKVIPRGNTVNIDQLNVNSASYNLIAKGQWSGTANAQHTAIEGKLTTENLGEFLQNWNVTKNLNGGNGFADFDLQWPGAPYQFALKNVAGQISLRFNDGSIINLSPGTETEIGLGRVLNLFSLQSIPRSLRMGFSNLTDSGFGFDIMKGDFSLGQGNATTTNAYLDGPIAKVVIRGRIGLSNQDYDLVMTVTPYITSTIPTVVATVAGGPIAGAITWAASKVFSTAVKEIVSYSYQVTGSWDNPNVVKIEGNKNE